MTSDKIGFSFGHMADLHLDPRLLEGKAQLARRYDFFDVYLDLCQELCDAHVDFVLIAGDLFDRATTREWGRSVARAGLELFKTKDIPVYAITGNHDAPDQTDGLSLLHELQELRLLTLLENGALKIRLKNNHEVIIYGLSWSGAATARLLSEIDLDAAFGPAGENRKTFNILMAHCGLDQLTPIVMPENVPYDVWQRFVPYVDYVALGHIHKPFSDAWRYMPGSPETLRRNEYHPTSAGALLVGVNDNRDVCFVDVITSDKRRPYLILATTVDDLFSGSRFNLLRSSIKQPVVVVTVSGETDQSWVDIEAKVRALMPPDYLYLQVVNETTTPDTPPLRIELEDLRTVEQQLYDELLPPHIARVAGEVMAAAYAGDYQTAARLVSEIDDDEDR